LSQQSPLARAPRYSLTLWAALTRYTTNGRCDIGNDPAERALCPLALGRKNWLFVGSHKGVDKAAFIVMFTQTSKLKYRLQFFQVRSIVLTAEM
jgi:transposase